MVCKGLPYTLLLYKSIQSNQPHRGHSLAGLPRLVWCTKFLIIQQILNYSSITIQTNISQLYIQLTITCQFQPLMSLGDSTIRIEEMSMNQTGRRSVTGPEATPNWTRFDVHVQNCSLDSIQSSSTPSPANHRPPIQFIDTFSTW